MRDTHFYFVLEIRIQLRTVYGFVPITEMSLVMVCKLYRRRNTFSTNCFADAHNTLLSSFCGEFSVYLAIEKTPNCIVIKKKDHFREDLRESIPLV